MSYNIDFPTAASAQIERALTLRLEEIRLGRNMTQADLAREAGVSLRTVGRMAKGEAISLDTFIRILTAFRIQSNLALLLPDPSVRPVERVDSGGQVRKRVRSKPRPHIEASWAWGDEDGRE